MPTPIQIEQDARRNGHHLPRAVARCLVRVKTPARTILTCDASGLAGLPPGRYRLWEEEFDVLPDEKIVVSSSGYLADAQTAWPITDYFAAGAVPHRFDLGGGETYLEQRVWAQDFSVDGGALDSARQGLALRSAGVRTCSCL